MAEAHKRHERENEAGIRHEVLVLLGGSIATGLNNTGQLTQPILTLKFLTYKMELMTFTCLLMYPTWAKDHEDQRDGDYEGILQIPE